MSIRLALLAALYHAGGIYAGMRHPEQEQESHRGELCPGVSPILFVVYLGAVLKMAPIDWDACSHEYFGRDPSMHLSVFFSADSYS
jgi:hypothetical protein